MAHKQRKATSRGCLPRPSTYVGVQVHTRNLCGTRRTAGRYSSAVSCSSHVGAKTGTWKSLERPEVDQRLRGSYELVAAKLPRSKQPGQQASKNTEGAVTLAIQKPGEEKVGGIPGGRRGGAHRLRVERDALGFGGQTAMRNVSMPFSRIAENRIREAIDRVNSRTCQGPSMRSAD